MGQGKILISDKSDNYLLKLVGDVRLTLSGTLNRYMEILFGKNQVKSVVVDMLDADGVDSTTLGLIAKLGLHSREYYQINVKLFCQKKNLIQSPLVLDGSKCNRGNFQRGQFGFELKLTKLSANVPGLKITLFCCKNRFSNLKFN